MFSNWYRSFLTNAPGEKAVCTEQVMSDSGQEKTCPTDGNFQGMPASSNNDYSEIHFLRTSKFFLSPPVPVLLLVFTATVVARLLVFKAAMKLRRRGWEQSK